MFVHTMTYFENNLIFHKKGKKRCVNTVQFLMKFFVLLYINSPVFEKQIKAAKNKWFHFPIYAHTYIWMCMCVHPY